MADAIHIACPHCDTVNRVPAGRLAEGANCGRCKRPLFMRQPLELDAWRCMSAAATFRWWSTSGRHGADRAG